MNPTLKEKAIESCKVRNEIQINEKYFIVSTKKLRTHLFSSHR